MTFHPDTLAIATGRPPVVPDGPMNVPITPASALHAGGESGYARDGHHPWRAVQDAISALEGGHAVVFSSGMAAATAVMALFAPQPIVVAPTVTYMSVREGLARLRGEVRSVDITDTDAVTRRLSGRRRAVAGVADQPAARGRRPAAPVRLRARPRHPLRRRQHALHAAAAAPAGAWCGRRRPQRHQGHGRPLRPAARRRGRRRTRPRARADRDPHGDGRHARGTGSLPLPAGTAHPSSPSGTRPEQRHRPGAAPHRPSGRL